MATEATSSSPGPLLGTVLVTGGCGFLGYHLVDRLLKDPECGAVYVLDLKTTTNTHPEAVYIRGSVTDSPDTLSKVLDTIHPTVVFHAASPSATYAPRSSFYATNVQGTKTLLTIAREKPYVKALVYTSSVDIYSDPPHHYITEAHPLWPDHPPPWKGVNEYDRTKTVAHRLVLASNSPPRLSTAVIVPAHMWGVRDSQALSLFFDTFADPRKPLWQVGPGTNVLSCVEAGNCATAHILAAKCLVDPARIPDGGGRVDGEAFIVTDGQDVNMWDDIWSTCALIRGPASGTGEGAPKVHMIPAWVMALVVEMAKWLYLIFTLGYAEPPPTFGQNGLSWCTEEHTQDDSKARKTLGYRPAEIKRSEMMAEAVEWERERRKKLVAGKKDE